MNSQVINLLCVDDEVEILNALKRLFRQAKFNVTVASSGNEALAILTKSNIDIIISDVCMPQMNGVDFLSQAYKNWPMTKRIVLTGFANMEDTLKIINDCDIYRYFSKPWDKDELVKSVEHAAEQKWLSEENVRLMELTREQNNQLRSLNSQLDKKVKDSNQRLDRTTVMLQDEIVNEKKLIEQKVGADKANQAKSRFLATMSHEIRSPLNSIIVMNNLLLETDLSDQQREYSAQAHQAGQMLLSLVNDILDFSKIESGQIELNNQWFNLEKVINSTHEILNGQAKLKGIAFDCSCAESILGDFNGDEIRLKQIILNLVANAIKFTEKGTVSLKVFREESSHNLIIEVKDTGIGIALSQQKYIFNEFAQVEDDENRRFGGTGLGLSIVKRLIGLMKGVISLSSEVNVGSTFTIALPLNHRNTVLKKHPNKKVIDPSLNISNSKSSFVPYKDAKILVVEDSDTNIAVIKALLSSYSFQLSFARNGQEAIEKAHQTEFSVILMDLSMPIMNGLEATFWLRNNDNINQKTPIIAMTANAFAEDKVRCFQVGMDDYLTKPIEIDLFFKCLYKHLAQDNSSKEQLQTTGDVALKPQSLKATAQTTKNKDTTTSLTEENNESEEQVFDLAILDRLISDISLEIFPKILNVYQEETLQRIKVMQDLLSSNNWHGLSDEAHALKSSSGSFGLVKLQQVAKMIEHAKSDSEQQQASEDILTLNKLYKISISELECHIENLTVESLL